jgi:hypothetical protein
MTTNAKLDAFEAVMGAVTAMDGQWSPGWIEALRVAAYQMAYGAVDALLLDYLCDFASDTPELRITRDIDTARDYMPRSNLDGTGDFWTLRWFTGEHDHESVRDALIADVTKNGEPSTVAELERALARKEAARRAMEPVST